MAKRNHPWSMGRVTLPSTGSHDISEEGATVGRVVTPHRRVLGFLHARSLGPFSPLVQRVGVSPHLDGIDPFRIHRVSRNGDVNTPIELAGRETRSPNAATYLSRSLAFHEFVAGQ